MKNFKCSLLNQLGFKRAVAIAIVSASAVVAVTGCVKNPGDLFIPGPDKNTYFDFETRTNVKLSLDYRTPGFQALFQVFAENPLKYEDNPGSVILKDVVKPIFMAYTDSNSKFEGDILIPTGTETIWLYTDRIGVSGCQKLTIVNGTISYVRPTPEMAGKASRISTSGSTMSEKWFRGGKVPYDLTEIPVGKAPFTGQDILNCYVQTQPNEIFSISKWTVGGVIVGQNPASDVFVANKIAGEETAANISERAQSFLDGIELGAERAKMLIKSPSVANVTVKEDKTTLSVTFLEERASYTNTFGYYYYKTTNAPRQDVANLYGDLKALKKYIIYPHLENNYLACGTTVKLKFFGENGDQPASDEFPKGYEVGWFVVPNGFVVAANNVYMPQYAIVDGITPNDPSTNQWRLMTSSNDMNTGSKDFRRFITLYDAKSKALVIGAEDIKDEGVPDDYCDVTFIVSSNVDLYDPELPPIPENPDDQPKIDDTFFGTLAFEDNWPTGGDYDMNDVVVEYAWKITFGKDNKATELEETYKVAHNGAEFRDFFAYQLPYGVVSASSGLTIESATSSVIIDQCIKDMPKPSTFTVKRTFSDPVDKETLKAAFNPYIIVHENKGAGRTEVHLPKHTATDLANKALNSTADDAYYVKKDGKYPFAINISVVDFKLAGEMIPIDQAYPSFRAWADSNGTTNGDWYKKK